MNLEPLEALYLGWRALGTVGGTLLALTPLYSPQAAQDPAWHPPENQPAPGCSLVSARIPFVPSAPRWQGGQGQSWTGPSSPQQSGPGHERWKWTSLGQILALSPEL